MFLGSTVGLAAGTTAMALNLKTLLFPDTDFRSAYSQPVKAAPDTVALCTTREPYKSRKRIGYLWALRIPDATRPALKIGQPNHVPAGSRSIVKMNVSDSEAKLLGRVRGWNLQAPKAAGVPVIVNAMNDQRALEINLNSGSVPPGRYSLAGMWDWDPLKVDGELFVDPLGDFNNARLTSDSQYRLRPQIGKQLINLEGADFQFVDKALLLRKDDKYATPTPVPFSLPVGSRRGPQSTLELQVDTAGLTIGDYSLMLYQPDGKPQTVALKVVPEPPKLKGLPVTLNEGEPERELTLEGEGLDRITGLSAPGYKFELGPATENATQRSVRVRRGKEPLTKPSLDLRV